jgi:hypothetical protein
MNSGSYFFGQSANTGSSPGSSSTIMNILFYGLVITFVALIILVIIHFTYKPVFGTAGGVLSGDSGLVKWEDEKSSTHEDISSNICDTVYYNYSLCFDIILDVNHTGNTNVNIITQKSPSGAGEPNFTFYLEPNKNDLHFLVKTKDGDNIGTKEIIISNVPIRKEFNVGFILSDKFMEAYVNGALYKTQVFPAPARLMESTTNLVFRDELKTNDSPPVRIKRLRLWGTIVSPDVMRAYGSTVSPSFNEKSDNLADGTCG